MFSSQERFVENQINVGDFIGAEQDFKEIGSANPQYSQTKGQQIAYIEAGMENDSTPIVFLHGWAIAAKPYQEILHLLSQRHHVIMPDLPGFGGSRDCGLVPSYDRYAEYLLAFLAALKLDRVHIIGHSIGGGIGITMATLAPDKIASLILLDSTGIPEVSLLEIPFRRALEMTLQISPAKLYLQFLEIPQVFVPNLAFNLPNVLTALWLALEKDIQALLPQIQSPCLLLWSAKDLTTPLEAGEKMQQAIPNSRLIVVEEGYHEWGLWYPEKFSAIVSRFLEDINSN